MAERVSMWVHPNFRKALQKKKIDAGSRDMISFTEDFAEELEHFPLKEKKKNDKEPRFF